MHQAEKMRLPIQWFFGVVGVGLGSFGTVIAVAFFLSDLSTKVKSHEQEIKMNKAEVASGFMLMNEKQDKLLEGMAAVRIDIAVLKSQKK